MSIPLTEDDVLRQAQRLWPDAVLDQDEEGQLVIHTGLYPAGTVTTTEKTYDSLPKAEQRLTIIGEIIAKIDT